MAKMRVNELARELGAPNREILAYLNENGHIVKSHSSSIEDDAIDLVRRRFQKDGGAGGALEKPEQAEKPAPAEKPAEVEKTVPAEKPAEAKPVAEPAAKPVEAQKLVQPEQPAEAKPVRPSAEKVPAEPSAAAEGERRRRPRPKKKNVTTVINRKYLTPQGGDGDKGDRRSNDARRRDRNRRSQERDGGHRGGGQSVSPNRIIRPRPESERTVRPRATQPRPEEKKSLSAAPSVEETLRAEEHTAAESAPVVNTAPEKDKSISTLESIT
ncbi:MAG: translation initiation factor IF-2 N-terminal domain-containing protein, partial [Lachnospiraceae bacterium]|nr:translation initiation factor IF-2 N-terminal domain-containing protein [Lachnospiraceae bacterium]